MEASQCEDGSTVHQDSAVYLHQMETDPALWWSISDKMVQYWLQVGPELCRNRDGIYYQDCSKYYSFSIDSTPDISHMDQLTFTVRYVHEDGMPADRFLKFEEIHSHSGFNLFNTIIEDL